LIFGATNYTTKIGTYSLFILQIHLVSSNMWLSFVSRCLVDWLCDGRVDAGTTPLPW
jgi:hypothetical protein